MLLAAKRLSKIPSIRHFGGMMGMEGKPCADPVGEKIKLWESDDRTAILLTLSDKPGSLNDALSVFKQYNINMTSIQSRPPKHATKQAQQINFHIDFNGSLEDSNIKQAMQKIETIAVKNGLVYLGTKEVPWFPTKIEDFNLIGKRILGEGDGI
jgi:hypothetical protein